MPRSSLGIAVDRIYPAVIAFAANTNVAFQFDLTGLVEEHQFQLSGLLTNAGYTTPPVKRAEGIENLIGMLRINGTGKVNGAQTADYCAVDGPFLAYKTRLMETVAADRVDAGTANAAYQFLSTFKRYYGLSRLQGFASTFLESRLLGTFSAAFQFRDINALIQPGTGVAGTSALSGVQLTVKQREWRNGNISRNRGYVRETQRKADLTNAVGLDRKFPTPAPVGNVMIRQTFKGTVGDVDYADPSDAIFATTQRAEGPHIKVIQNATWMDVDTTYPQARADQRTLYNLASLPAGYVTQEYSRTRNPNDALDLRAVRTLDNVFDLSFVGGSTNTLQITDEEIVMPGA